MLKNKFKNMEYIFYIIAFIILTIPRSIDTVFPEFYDIINIVKLIVTVLIGLNILKNKTKISKITIALIIYAAYLFLVTIFNKVTPITFIKVYGLNIGIFLLCDLIFNSKVKDKFIRFFSNYFLVLLIVNLVLIIVSYLNGNPFSLFYGTYLLGQDNRFILYIIPALLGFFYLSRRANKKSDKIKLVLTYIVGTYTVYFLWSVASLVALLFIGVSYIFIKLFKKVKINIKFLSLIIIAICVGIVFFKIQNNFRYFIVNVLNKSMTLSYRTLIWDRALEMLSESNINLLFGFGYFDTSHLFDDIQGRLNHLHNLILDPLFSSGVIGLVMYTSILYCIIKKIDSIKKTFEGKLLALVFSGILVLLIFDTFEAYQIYYFVLYLLYVIPCILKEKTKDVLPENIKLEEDSKVGVLLATYNGEKYLKEQLDSIINQSYKNWVIYISDDHSTDNTINIITEYKEKYGDKIVILENENKFCSAKMNFANLFEKADDLDYYIFCDQDDVWDKEKITKLLYKMKEEEKANNNLPILVYSDLKIVDEKLNTISESLVRYENKFLPEKKLFNHILIENYFPGCAIMFNKKLRDKAKDIYSETEMHDWWVTLVAAFGGKIVYVDEPLHLYRQHSNNTVGAKKDKNIIQRYLIRIKKLFKFDNMHSTWKKYQDVVLKQAEELQVRYKEENNENIKTLNEFIDIMKTKNKLKRLILLIIKGYIPREKVRIFRLVI